MHFGVIWQQTVDVLIKRERMIDRVPRTICRSRRSLVEQVSIVGAYLVEFPTGSPDLGKSTCAPEPLVSGADELELPVLVGKSVIEGEADQLEIWSPRPRSQDILSQIGIGYRLLLLLHVVTQAAQVPRLKRGTRSSMSHCSPKLATRGSPPSRSRSTTREIDVIDVGRRPLAWRPEWRLCERRLPAPRQRARPRPPQGPRLDDRDSDLDRLHSGKHVDNRSIRPRPRSWN